MFHTPAFRLLSLATMLGLCCMTFLGCEGTLDENEVVSLDTKNAMEVLPAEARLIGKLNIEEMQKNEMTNPFGSSRFSLDNFSGEAAARLQDVFEATDFNPEEDIREVYLATQSPGSSADPSLVIYADYDRDALEKYLSEQLNGELERFLYRNVPVYRKRSHDHAIVFALANDEMIIASPKESNVETMLDRLAGQGDALRDDPETMHLVSQSARGSAWFVIRDINYGDGYNRGNSLENQIAKIGSAIKDVTVSIDVDEDLVRGTLHMSPREDISPEDLTDLMKGVVALMKIRPDLKKYEKQFLEKINIRQMGDQVRLQATLDEDLLRSLR